MPEETRRSRRNGWFHTGDIARLDEAGYLHFVSRMSERIRVLGEMISAYEIEEAVLSHPAVEDCAVIGVPSRGGEESVRAFVTVRPGSVLTEEKLREFRAANMSRFMVPEVIRFLDSMPRTPSGKAAKSLLQNMT